MIPSPCKECNERKLGCRKSCEKYVEWKFQMEKDNAERDRIRQMEYDAVAVARNNIRKR